MRGRRVVSCGQTLFCTECGIGSGHAKLAKELERTSDSMSASATKSTKRGTYEKYTTKEKAETSCYAWYHSHNKASHPLQNFAAITKFLTRKLIIL